MRQRIADFLRWAAQWATTVAAYLAAPESLHPPVTVREGVCGAVALTAGPGTACDLRAGHNGAHHEASCRRESCSVCTARDTGRTHTRTEGVWDPYEPEFRVSSVTGRSHVTNTKAGMWDPDRKGTVSVVLGRGYPSSGRPATDLSPPPRGPAPGGRTG